MKDDPPWKRPPPAGSADKTTLTRASSGPVISPIASSTPICVVTLRVPSRSLQACSASAERALEGNRLVLDFSKDTDKALTATLKEIIKAVKGDCVAWAKGAGPRPLSSLPL